MQTELYTKSGNRTSNFSSTQAAAALTTLERMGVQEAAIMGRAPVLTEPKLVNGWTFVPWEQDDCNLPPIAWQRMIVLQDAGIKPLSWVIAHEPPTDGKQTLLLPAQQDMRSGWEKAKSQLATFRTRATPVAKKTAVVARDFAIAAAPVALEVGKVALQITAVAAAATGVVLLGALSTVGMVLAADPILFALLPADDGGDPVWVVVARWYEE